MPRDAPRPISLHEKVADDRCIRPLQPNRSAPNHGHAGAQAFAHATWWPTRFA